MDRRLPEQFPGMPMIAQHRLRLGLVIGGREEYLIPHDSRRAMAATGNGAFPQDVLRVAPLQRRLLLGICDSVSIGAAPPRPVRRTNRDGVITLLAAGFRCMSQGDAQSNQRDRDKSVLHEVSPSR